ncbi:AAA family ATPase [Streptomyces sp. NPDC088706]
MPSLCGFGGAVIRKPRRRWCRCSPLRFGWRKRPRVRRSTAGKTTLARLLADAFEVQLIETTATSEWSPYHVVGGFPPSRRWWAECNPWRSYPCCPTVRPSRPAGRRRGIRGGSGRRVSLRVPGCWLFIDEFNRADIDKAIGSLFTVLSSCDARHLQTTPVELWFESTPDRQNLWVPARFRIIGTMNDLDTSFVNRMSQGLTRRFQFVTVGVPTERASTDQPITELLRDGHRSGDGLRPQRTGPPSC